MAKEEVLLEEIVKLLAVLAVGNKSQAVAIKELSDVGFEPKRIAELLGTTANNVRVTLHKVKKGKQKSK